MAVIVQILHVQTAEKQRWQSVEKSQIKTDVVVRPNRGNIYDVHGNLLAGSVPQYYVYMDTRVEALHLNRDSLFLRYVDSIADGLSHILQDTTPQAYRARMVKAFHAKKASRQDFRVCKRRVNYIEMERIKKLPLVNRGYYASGFHFEQQYLRAKPYGSLGSRTLGTIYSESGKGYTGLEKSFESYLHGTEGLSRKQKVAGKLTDVPIKEAIDGFDIVTTLDAQLMDITETALRQRLNLVEGDWGCCILMETETGDIKAISNLDRTEDGHYVEKENHAVKRVEPGSTFKTFSLMAVLDDSKMDIDDTIAVTHQPWIYYDSKHRDSHPNDTVYTLRSALAVSSNIAFAKMVTQAYDKTAERFVTKLRKMGICDSLDCEIPGAEAPRIEIPKDKVTLSKMAYGYSVELSPLQIVSLYNAIANNGQMMQPRLVQSIQRNGVTEKRFPTRNLHSHICSLTTVRELQQALGDVVWDNQLGTASVRSYKGKIIGYKAQSNLVRIAGKTGTAQLLVNGRYDPHKHRITFVGYFPQENPQYTCICMISHPHNYGAYDAGWDCGRVVRQIAEQTMAYTGVYQIEDGKKVWKKIR